jgi:hypothetical protein
MNGTSRAAPDAMSAGQHTAQAKLELSTLKHKNTANARFQPRFSSVVQMYPSFSFSTFPSSAYGAPKATQIGLQHFSRASHRHYGGLHRFPLATAPRAGQLVKIIIYAASRLMGAMQIMGAKQIGEKMCSAQGHAPRCSLPLQDHQALATLGTGSAQRFDWG